MRGKTGTGILSERLLALTLSCLMIAGFAPGNAFAAQETQQTGKEEIAAQAALHDDPFAPEDGYEMQTRASMPSTFDLRHVTENGKEHNYVTSVKLQYPYGSCWGFAAIAAAETSILGKYASLKADTLDLSEKQVTWFNASVINDPDHPQKGEGYYFEEPVTAQNRYDAGGFTSFATNLFAQGVGPVAEDTDTADGNVYRYKGRRGEVINGLAAWVDEDGNEQTGYRKLYYSEDDDWSIPEKYRFAQDYILKESYLLPSLANYKDEEKGPVIDAIKEQLLQKHAVAINFCADSSKPGQEQDEDGMMNLTTWAQYTDYGYPSNHAVTIIGYDDNYPKSNFLDEPPGDGAWLVKNSWGSDLSDFPNNGYRHWGLLEGQDIPGSDYSAVSQMSTGYFWLSYYDKTIRDPEAYSFEKAGTGYIIDQHDYMPVMEYEEYATETENKTANVFSASKNEMLTDISYFTAAPGTSVSYRVYLLNDGAENPEDGQCIASSSPEVCPYGGYHRVTLPEDSRVVLPEGQKYSIVVTQITPAGKYSISFAESDGEELVRGLQWFKAVVNEGESYLYIDSEWNDLSDPEFRNLLKDKAEGKEIDNFPIKAYSTPVDNMGGHLAVKTGSGKDAAEFSDVPGGKLRLITSIRGATDDLVIQPVITWTLDNPELVSLEKKKGGEECIITLVNPGETILTVDAGIYGKKEIPITVEKPRIAGGKIDEKDKFTVYTGQPYEPAPVEVYYTIPPDYESCYDLTRDVDYIVTYENNILCGRGEARITGTGEFGGEVWNTAYSNLSFRILPAKAEITGVRTGSGKLSVEFVSQKDSGISGYVLSYKETGTDEIQTMKLAADAESAVITGLEAGKTYDISLKAYVTVEEDLEWDYDLEDYVGGPTDYFGEESDVVTGGAVAPGNPFTDVLDSDYFFEPVLWAVMNKITEGTSETTFSPEKECTRGQAVTFLWRACGSEKATDMQNPFTDVKESDYYYDAVLWACRHGVTNGTSETTFEPDRKCSRGQIVTFLWRAEGQPKAGASVSFTDVKPDSFCYAPVQWAVEKGVTKGTSETTFSPSEFCTRGQIVTFLYRAMAEKPGTGR